MENRTDKTVKEEPLITEWCSNCCCEVDFLWDVKKRGYAAPCPQCGELLMLCGECQNENPRPNCDYDRETDLCLQSLIRRFPELGGYDEENHLLLPREPAETIGEQLTRYEIVFVVETKRYYCFVDALSVNEALGLFFSAHPHISYEMVVDHVEYGEGAETPPLILELNQLANVCGWFHNACLTDDAELNNGYNCRHEKQEEFETVHGKRIGCCYAHSCPLAYSADYEDLVHHGVIDATDYAGPEDYAEGHDYDYMIVSDKELTERLRASGVTGLAKK